MKMRKKRNRKITGKIEERGFLKKMLHRWVKTGEQKTRKEEEETKEKKAEWKTEEDS